MADSTHKYYCPHCMRYVFGASLEVLASEVNLHAARLHPADCASWSAAGIAQSAHYTGATGPLPQYLAVHGTTSHHDSVLPALTVEDRAMLAKGLVLWD
jgi:hypothetical protein